MDVENLFIEYPSHWIPSEFMPKGWTGTIEGYKYEARKLTTTLWNNLKQTDVSYPLVAHLNIEDELSANEHRDLWTKACRNMRRAGLVALWVREPSKPNRIHYHIILRQPTTEAEVRSAIEKAMPSRSEVSWRLRVEPVKLPWRLLHYVTKAEIEGMDDGTWRADMHASKRLLFQAHLGLKKYGTIGHFWAFKGGVTAYHEATKAQRTRISKGACVLGLHDLCCHLYDLFDGTVAFRRIERCLALNAESPGIKLWLDQITSDEWSDNASLN